MDCWEQKTKLFFSVVTKNLNWEVLTKSLVTFKRWDGIKDEKLEYYGGYYIVLNIMKNPIFRGEGHKKPIYRGNFQKKRGAWTVCRFKGGRGGGAWQKRGGLMFLRKGEVLIPQCTLCI